MNIRFDHVHVLIDFIVVALWRVNTRRLLTLIEDKMSWAGASRAEIAIYYEMRTFALCAVIDAVRNCRHQKKKMKRKKKNYDWDEKLSDAREWPKFRSIHWSFGLKFEFFCLMTLISIHVTPIRNSLMIFFLNHISIIWLKCILNFRQQISLTDKLA